MSCIGQGLGEAMALMCALVVAIILGAVLNIASFRQQDAPRSTLRKVELWLFVSPFILTLGLVILFILR
jgi:heme/copper-type cytochrome/quinol oxidase subunit 2